MKNLKMVYGVDADKFAINSSCYFDGVISQKTVRIGDNQEPVYHVVYGPTKQLDMPDKEDLDETDFMIAIYPIIKITGGYMLLKFPIIVESYNDLFGTFRTSSELEFNAMASVWAEAYISVVVANIIGNGETNEIMVNKDDSSLCGYNFRSYIHNTMLPVVIIDYRHNQDILMKPEMWHINMFIRIMSIREEESFLNNSIWLAKNSDDPSNRSDVLQFNTTTCVLVSETDYNPKEDCTDDNGNLMLTEETYNIPCVLCADEYEKDFVF